MRHPIRSWSLSGLSFFELWFSLSFFFRNIFAQNFVYIQVWSLEGSLNDFCNSKKSGKKKCKDFIEISKTAIDSISWIVYRKLFVKSFQKNYLLNLFLFVLEGSSKRYVIIPFIFLSSIFSSWNENHELIFNFCHFWCTYSSNIPIIFFFVLFEKKKKMKLPKIMLLKKALCAIQERNLIFLQFFPFFQECLQRC